MTMLVQDMYDGVKAMIKREKELRPAAAKQEGKVKAGSHLKSISDITGEIVFPVGTKSLLSKYLTPAVY